MRNRTNGVGGYGVVTILVVDLASSGNREVTRTVTLSPFTDDGGRVAYREKIHRLPSFHSEELQRLEAQPSSGSCEAVKPGGVYGGTRPETMLLGYIRQHQLRARLGGGYREPDLEWLGYMLTARREIVLFSLALCLNMRLHLRSRREHRDAWEEER